MSPSRCRAPRRPSLSASQPVRSLIARVLTLLIATVIALGVAPFGPLPLAYAAGTLTVKVYVDAARDGVDTGGAEPGLGGVSVAVYSVDNLLVGLNNTNAGGVVTFPDLPDGEYRVEVGPLSGYVVSVPGAANTNPGLVSRVAIAGAATTVSVGVRQLSGGIDTGAPAGTRSITPRVWDDRDGDGIQDADEPGVTGLTLELLDSASTVVAIATAGADGRYRFDSAPTGAGYTVRISAGLPAGYTLTRQDVAGSAGDGRDSDGIVATFPPAIASVPSGGRGVNTDSVDLGLTRGAITGLVWRDTNNDGTYDAGIEPPINGVPVELIQGGSVLSATVTRSEQGAGASDGIFRFTGLDFGTYRVRVPGSAFATGAILFGAANSPTTGSSDDQATPDGIATGPVETGDITLSAGDVAAGSHTATSLLGFYKGTAGDFVWYDLDRDGFQDVAEDALGINGILIFVDDGRDGGTPNNGIRDGGEIATTTINSPFTGQQGYYLFDDLPLSATPYRFVLDPSNFAPGGPLEGFGSSNATAATTAGGAPYYYREATLDAAGPLNLGVDFGLTRSDVGNYVFLDADGNGIFNEPATSVISNATVRLIRNSTGTAVFTTTTDATGVYTIPNVPAIPYYVTVDVSTAAAPFNSAVASLQPSGAAVDPDETGGFPNYSDVITRVNTTTWRTPVFTPTVGAVNNGVDAGFYLLTEVSGRAFFDTDVDDQDEVSPEPGMRGVTVQLRRSTDLSLVATTTTTTTNSTGVYTFTAVAPGSYVIDFVNPVTTTFDFVTPDVPAAGDPLASDVDSTGRTATLVVTSGSPISEVDAGFAGTGSLSGRVFLDNDGSNTQNPGDSNLVGATAALTVTANLPNLVATYNPPNVLPVPTADSDPNYRFPGLPGGTGVIFSLNVAPPAATPPYLASTANQGGDDSVDSDGPSIVLNNPDPGLSLDLDQGYYQNATVTARVFEESSTPLAIDNAFAAGDAGVGGVRVVLETLAGSPVLTGTTVASTGLVTFTVRPGAYRLNVDEGAAALAGLLPSEPNFSDPVTVTGSPLSSGASSLTDSAGANSFGYYRPASLSGRAYFDRDGDGLAAGEPGLEGVTVEVLQGGSPVLTTTTSATGAYSFSGVLPGDYSVRFSNPDATNFAFLTTGDSDVTTGGPVASSSTGTISAPYGGTVSDVQAGFVGQATVSGTTFVDQNGDGQQGGDPALDGVQVTLTQNVAIPGRLTTTITRAVTTAGGTGYSFGGLPGGTAGQASFNLSFTPPTATPPWQLTLADQGSDASDSDGELLAQPLAPGATADRDQGYYQNATITARVFSDGSLPPNNRWNSGETGIGGVRVVLETLAGSPVLTGTTVASTGLVTFTVRPGDYRLNIDESSAALAGLAPAPGNSEPTAVAGTPLTSGEASLTEVAPEGTTNVFGYFRAGNVTGRIFFDGRSGPADDAATGEPGLSGVTVRLLDSTLAVTATTTTDATGVYTFTNVTPLTYTVEFDNPDPANFVYRTGAAGDNSVASLSADDGRTAAFQVTSGITVTRSAAVEGLGAITGRTFIDKNGNGQQDDSAPADLDGTQVNLTLAVDLTNLATTITRAATTTGGLYSFAGLPGDPDPLDATEVASYTLTFTPPTATPPWQLTLADQGSDAVDSDGEIAGQTLARGATDDRDQGYYQPVTIVARVFDEQVTVNNTPQTGEPGIPGVTVSLSTSPVISATTGATGLVTFTVAPGTYQLTLIDPSGYTRSPGNSPPVTVGPLLSGESAPAVPFGYYQPATLTGSVWFDTNGNGTIEAGEPPMEGIAVQLVGDVNGVISSTLTTALGAYSFGSLDPTGLPGGDASYQLCFDLPGSFAFTVKGANPATDNNSDVNHSGPDAGCTDPITLGSSQTVEVYDAGYVGTLTIGDLVWSDLNADGLQDPGEPGLGGVTVTVAISTTGINASNPTLVFTTTTTASTDLAPNYQLSGLPPASGWVLQSVVAPLGYVPAPVDQGGDDTIDSDPPGAYPVALPPSTADLDVGFVQTTAVGDLVWLDLNGNGTYEAGVDRGLPGVTVELLSGDTVIDTTTTSGPIGPSGLYSFDDLAPGDYRVRFTAPGGYTFVNDGAGSPTVDNDNDARLDGTTAVFTLSGGQALNSIDAGLRGTASISGLVWVDTNSNSLRDPADTGRLGGVQVTLTLTPTLAGAPTAVFSTTTAADGSYRFDGLGAGSAAVRFTTPTGYQPVTPNAGNDTLDSDGPLATLTLLPGATITTLDQGYRERGQVLYLPLLNAGPQRPDLVVSFQVSPASPTAGRPASIEVTVTNQGAGPASGFWVDFYINPARPPQVNDPWNELCALDPCFGLAWFFDGTLEPGQSVVLNSNARSTTNPNGFRPEASIWSGYFANGTSQLYAIVDSWNRDAGGGVRDPNGALRESDETNNRAEQAIIVQPGPLPAATPATPGSLTPNRRLP